MDDETGGWAIRTSAPVQIERRRMDDDEDLAPDAAIIGAFVEERLVARSMTGGDWTPEHDQGLFDVPRVIQYIASETEGGGIRAELCAVIPAADIPREPWQPEPEGDTPDGVVLLGVVVRLAHERTQGTFQAECLDHFMKIMNLGAEPVVDRLLRSV
jgi:hypothetical protein